MFTKDSFRRWSIVMLCLIMAVTCFPLYEGAEAFASEDEYKYEVETIKAPGADPAKLKAEAEGKVKAEANAADIGIIGTDDPSDDVDVTDEADIEAEGFAGDDVPSLDAGGTEPGSPEVVAPQDEPYVIKAEHVKFNSKFGLQSSEKPDEGNYSAIINMYNNGDVKLDASLYEAGWTFGAVWMDEDYNDVDGIYVPEGSTEIHQTFNMKQFDIGYHTLMLSLDYYGNKNVAVISFTKVPRPIYDKPSIQQSDFMTKWNYFTVKNNGNSCDDDYSCDLYIDIKKGNGSWVNGYGPIPSYETRKKSGLSAATQYSVRSYYKKYVTYPYDSVTYSFVSPYSNTVKIKTAYKKPKVKSIKITKTKVKRHKRKYWTGYVKRWWRVNLRTGARRLIKTRKIYRTVKWTTTKFKVTVKFKKKQGIRGIYIGTIQGMYAWKKGNKKSYSQTFTASGKKKGKKLKVRVKSWMSDAYGGESGTYSKKVKAR